MNRVRTLQLGTVLMLVLSPLIASACDVTIGDWKLVRGDVSAVELLPVSPPSELTDDIKNILPKGNWKPMPSDPRPEVSVTLSDKVKARFADLTRPYVGNRDPLPIMVGSIKKAPVLYEPILDGSFVLNVVKDDAEADKLIKTLRNCI